jgi:lipopolysaccharide export LptBFGC system permease protein LptF
MVVSKGVPAANAAALFALMLPNVLSLSMPISVLFGAILSYGRLSSDNEITAVRTAGIRHIEYMSPPVIFAAFLAAALVFYNLNLAPKTYESFSRNYFEIARRAPALRLEKKTVAVIGANRVYFEDRTNDGVLLRVSIYRFAEGTLEPSALIYASSATAVFAGDRVIFKMYSGAFQKVDPKSPAESTSLRFAGYNVVIPMDSGAVKSRSLREYMASELLAEIKRLEAAGLAATERATSIPALKTELNLRIAIGLSPFFFALVGVPVGLLAGKGAKAAGFAFSLAVVFLYYIFLAVGINMSESGGMPSAVALALPNLAAAVASFFLWRAALKK